MLFHWVVATTVVATTLECMRCVPDMRATVAAASLAHAHSKLMRRCFTHADPYGYQHAMQLQCMMAEQPSG
jgi:hypothetical protein